MGARSAPIADIADIPPRHAQKRRASRTPSSRDIAVIGKSKTLPLMTRMTLMATDEGRGREKRRPVNHRGHEGTQRKTVIAKSKTLPPLFDPSFLRVSAPPCLRGRFWLPARGAMIKTSRCYTRRGKPLLSGSNSVVECQLPKLDVAGSIPVSRSKRPQQLIVENPGASLCVCCRRSPLEPTKEIGGASCQTSSVRTF